MVYEYQYKRYNGSIKDTMKLINEEGAREWEAIFFYWGDSVDVVYKREMKGASRAPNLEEDDG